MTIETALSSVNVLNIRTVCSANGETFSPPILRSSNPKHMTDNCKKVIGTLVDTVIDLRSTAEVVHTPPQRIESTKYVHVPIANDAILQMDRELEESVKGDVGFLKRSPQSSSSGETVAESAEISNELHSHFDESMFDLYADIIADTVMVKRFFNAALDSNGFMFHCASGKDRTGVMGMLLLKSLGYDYTTDILPNYLESNEKLKETHDEMIAITPFLYPVLYIKQEFLDHAVSTMINKYGSWNSYWSAVGIDCADVQSKFKVAV